MNTQKANDERRYHALEFGCGWGAGCIETCIVYPATKVSFRQQVHGYNVLGAIREIRAEGISLLYRGLLPPLLMRTTSRAVMFGLYDNFLTHFGGAKYTRGSSLFTVERAKAAFLAGACEASLAPLERIQVLLQADKYHKEFKNSGDAAVKIFKYYGIREYYRGISLVIARNGLSNILYFNLREPFKMFILDKSKIESHTALHLISDFLSGALLGATISTIFFPLNVIKNNVQSEMGPGAQSPIKVFLRLLRERGRITELYRGVHVNAFRSLCGWGITTSAYEALIRLFTSN